ncbi:MAG: TrlF family AAA-like ATPase [Flavisolibacter sp.]
MSNYAKGSEWRKWDLHVHTPHSIGGDYGIFMKNLAQCPADVIGLNDYCSIDGYSEVLKLGGVPNKVLFPVVEFRMNNIVANRRSATPTDSGTRINFHLIFDNNPTLFPTIQNWVRSLDCYNDMGVTAQLGTIAAGNLLKLTFDYKHVIESLEKYGLKKHTLIWLPYDEYGGVDEIDPEDNFFKLALINQADVMGSSYSGQIEFFKWRDKKVSLDQYKKWFHRPKACIKGSDAHKIDYPFGKLRDAKSEPTEKYCWIKSDPTFEGLVQITNEPDRVFIGEEPPVLGRVSDNPTKYIEKLEIKPISGSKYADHWFENFSISFNTELTAIIGNKGKGKSALADILGLCGNSHNYKSFSFLHKDKFRKPLPINYAKEFVATITWMSGHTDEKLLYENPDELSYERVKYIPQSFLETLCTNVDKKIFEEELEKVIFSRLDDAQKMTKGTLREIINHNKEIIENAIELKKGEIIRLNSEIVDLEYKRSPEYKKMIAEAVQQKQFELNAHIENKPAQVRPPQDDDASRQKMQQITTLINEARASILQINQLKTELSNRRNILSIEISDLTKLRDLLLQMKERFDTSFNNLSNQFARYGLQKDKIVSLQLDLSQIEQLLRERVHELDTINDQLLPKGGESFASRIETEQEKIKAWQAQLDGPNKAYQTYFGNLLQWEQLKVLIEGDDKKEGSLAYFKAIKLFIENGLETVLNSKYAARKEALIALLTYKHEIGDIYRALYKPVTEFIQLNKNELSDYNVNIDVAFQLKDFFSKFFNIVSNGNAGSFCGIAEGNTMLNAITEVVDFNDISEVVQWVEQLVTYMHFDKREGQENADRQLVKQLKGGNKEQDYYNFLFSLDYLEPSYQLKLGDKTLSELSPGERGALLLIFYLFLDKDDIPIIIDQPEENLDNQSVYKILVHFIKMAKARRQIIIITHNPNLAVVCDAEQVIRTNIDKPNNNKFTCRSGSIENPGINAEIIDVLEGTRPALENRTSKYEICNN